MDRAHQGVQRLPARRRRQGDATEQGRQGGSGLRPAVWSPDSKTLVAFRIEPGERKEVHLIESSPPGGGRAKLAARAPTPCPATSSPPTSCTSSTSPAERQIKPEVDRDRLRHAPRLRWNKDGHHFTYEKIDRGHQRFRLIEVDAHTGKARNLIDEKTETFIWTAHTENVGLPPVTWLEKTDEIIYVSESDGWRHLYLIDAKDGQGEEPDHQGRVGRPRRRPRSTRRSGRSGSAPAA